jgi:hypothetical protein
MLATASGVMTIGLTLSVKAALVGVNILISVGTCTKSEGDGFPGFAKASTCPSNTSEWRGTLIYGQIQGLGNAWRDYERIPGPHCQS